MNDRANCYNMRGELITHFVQWDHGWTIAFKTPFSENVLHVDFCNQNSTMSYRMEPNSLGDQKYTVHVPNELLMWDLPIFIYVVVEYADDEEITELFASIPVRTKIRPDDYVFVEDRDYMSLKEIEAEMKEEMAQYTEQENERVANESARQSAESTRQSNETSRQNAESTRESQEATRQANEETRIANEESRESAETQRESNESDRQSAESAREDQEATRQANEETRIANENQRIADHEKCQEATDAANEAADKANSVIDSAVEATDNANAAADNANQAADNANEAADNIAEIEEQIISDWHVSFDEADVLELIESGETLSEVFGKILKFMDSPITEEEIDYTFVDRIFQETLYFYSTEATISSSTVTVTLDSDKSYMNSSTLVVPDYFWILPDVNG